MGTTDSQAQQTLVHLYIILVANSILIYDHLVTLPEEIAFIWSRPKALSAMLFLVNRYVALFGNIFGIFSDFLPVSDESCSKYVLVREVHLFFQQFIVCFILSLRTYALYGRSRRLLGWMVIIGLILGGGAFAGSFGDDTSSATAALGNCYETYTAETAIRHGLAWLMIFVYELLIFVLTVFRICKTRALLRFSLLISRRNIIDIMFQDGAMYFAAMTMVNLANMLTYYCGPDIISGNLATFTSCISVTLISRLMLNLHKSIDTGIFSTTPTQDHDDSLAVLTTRVNVQSAISSHHW